MANVGVSTAIRCHSRELRTRSDARTVSTRPRILSVPGASGRSSLAKEMSRISSLSLIRRTLAGCLSCVAVEFPLLVCQRKELLLSPHILDRWPFVEAGITIVGMEIQR
jgi:hypothetical protein